MDKERIDTYLQAIAVETVAIADVLKNSDEKLLVHQYWRIGDTVFLNNLRAGVSDFKGFIHDIRKIIN